jgi:hypothetical protein
LKLTGYYVYWDLCIGKDPNTIHKKTFVVVGTQDIFKFLDLDSGVSITSIRKNDECISTISSLHWQNFLYNVYYVTAIKKTVVPKLQAN